MTETDTSRERLERLQSIGCADYLHMALLARAEKAEARALETIMTEGKPMSDIEERADTEARHGNREALEKMTLDRDRLRAALLKAEAERDTAWNDAIEAAAQTQIDKANYWSSLCNDDERCHYEAIAGEIRALRRGDTDD